MALAPGVRVQQLGGPGAFTTIQIRGLRTEDTAVLVATNLVGAAAVLAAVILLLAKVMPAWGGALIVGGVLLAITGTLAALGRRQLKRATPPVPRETVDSVKADVEEIKERAHR